MTTINFNAFDRKAEILGHFKPQRNRKMLCQPFIEQWQNHAWASST